MSDKTPQFFARAFSARVRCPALFHTTCQKQDIQSILKALPALNTFTRKCLEKRHCTYFEQAYQNLQACFERGTNDLPQLRSIKLSVSSFILQSKSTSQQDAVKSASEEVQGHIPTVWQFKACLSIGCLETLTRLCKPTCTR